MRQIRIAKHRLRRGGWRKEPLSAGPRDPDIVRAHKAARPTATACGCSPARTSHEHIRPPGQPAGVLAGGGSGIVHGAGVSPDDVSR